MNFFIFFLISLTRQQSNTLTLKYKLIDDFSFLQLNFSKPLKITSIEFEQLISVQVSGMDDDKYSFTVQSPPKLVDSNISTLEVYNQYTLILSYQQEFYFKEMTVRFVAPFNVKDYLDESYLNIKYQQFVIQIGPYIKHNQTEIQALEGLKISGLTILGLGLFFYLILTFRLLNLTKDITKLQSISLFWSMIDSMQLMNLFLFLNSELTEQVRVVLRVFNYVNFNYNSEQIFNFFGIAKDDYENKIFFRIQEEGLTTSFIKNTFIQWILLGFAVMLTIMTQMSKNEKLLSLIEYTLIIRISSLCMYSVCFSIFIELETISFEGKLNQADFIMMIFGIIWVLTFLGVSWHYLNVQAPTLGKDKPAINVKFRALNDGLHPRAVFKRNLLFFFELRKILITATIIFLYQKQNTCISLMIVIQIIYVTVLATKFPFKIQSVNFIMIVTDILILSITILLGIIILMDYITPGYLTFETRETVGWLVGGLILMVPLMRLIFMVIEYQQLGFGAETMTHKDTVRLVNLKQSQKENQNKK